MVKIFNITKNTSIRFRKVEEILGKELLRIKCKSLSDKIRYNIVLKLFALTFIAFVLYLFVQIYFALETDLYELPILTTIFIFIGMVILYFQKISKITFYDNKICVVQYPTNYSNRTNCLLVLNYEDIKYVKESSNKIEFVLNPEKSNLVFNIIPILLFLYPKKVIINNLSIDDKNNIKNILSIKLKN